MGVDGNWGVSAQRAPPGRAVADCFQHCWANWVLNRENFKKCALPQLLTRCRRFWTTRDAGGHVLQPRESLDCGFFFANNLNREIGDWCFEWLDDLRHKHHILHDFRCFFALQKTCNWRTSAMNVLGHIAYRRDHSRTAILRPRELNHFRLSWVDRERCTAIMVVSTLLLPVHMPHIGHGEEDDNIKALETERATLTEGRKVSAIDVLMKWISTSS